jgi:hypothetical protein
MWGVVPIQAWVAELDAIGELPSYPNRRLRLMRDAVVTVLQPQPVPVDSRVKVTVVLNVDDDLGALGDLQSRTRDGAVIAEHPHGRVAEPLGHRADAQLQGVAVGQLHQLGPAGLGQSGGVGRERIRRRW